MIPRIIAAATRFGRALNPHPESWRGIARGLHVAAWLVLILVAAAVFWQAPSIYNALALLLIAVVLFAAVTGVYLGVALLGKIAPALRWSLTLLLAVSLAPFAGLGPGIFALVAALVIACALCGAGYANYRRLGAHWATYLPAAIGALGVLTLAGVLVSAGWEVDEEISWQPMQSTQLELADPSAPGPFAIERFTYGPGTETRRGLFGANVRYKTEPVNAAKLLAGWEGNAGWARSNYWQAGPESLPLRGAVWMPVGEGPFPLVLIVHGNHAMEDFSDDGYAYLGELFASRGIIAVSVDQNFLNSSGSNFLSLFSGGLEEESDARGWLLLEHLRQWRDWHDDPAHELRGKADLDRIVLIGHSRGGEAVGEAALFNRLPAYPDDATLVFDYNFGIRGVIGVAPVDHQYQPRERYTELRGISYLVMHGSHDSDVASYAGYATYARLNFAGCADCFKAGFYLLGANHGQFNTGWGRYDVPAPYDRFLNVLPLIDGVQQRQVAKVMFGAFVETVLLDNTGYRPFIASPDRARALLPETARWLSHYVAASDLVLADFEEDADVGSATAAGLQVSGRHLTLWRESEVALKWRTTASAMALLGWDSDAVAQPAEYEISGIAKLRAASAGEHALTFALGMSNQTPGEIEDYEPPETVDFSVVVIDEAGHSGSLPLSVRRTLLPQVAPVMYKHRSLNPDAPSEVVLQRYRFALHEFSAANPEFDINRLDAVRFVFDRTVRGSVWLDDVTLSTSGD